MLAKYAREVDFSWQTKLLSLIQNVNLKWCQTLTPLTGIVLAALLILALLRAIIRITTVIGLHRMMAPMPGFSGDKIPVQKHDLHGTKRNINFVQGPKDLSVHFFVIQNTQRF
jgi:hypothetical protein